MKPKRLKKLIIAKLLATYLAAMFSPAPAPVIHLHFYVQPAVGVSAQMF